jgi:hypothetical protein
MKKDISQMGPVQAINIMHEALKIEHPHLRSDDDDYTGRTTPIKALKLALGQQNFKSNTRSIGRYMEFLLARADHKGVNMLMVAAFITAIGSRMAHELADSEVRDSQLVGALSHLFVPRDDIKPEALIED